jgi:pyruvate dehydrogenase E2 component (dihydrolipoamide acetyltransferase)
MTEGALDAVTIPKWGIEMTHGRIVAWHKAVGDSVSAGEEIVDIETDKIVNSFEARTSGTLVRILASEGEELAVGRLIGVIAKALVDESVIEAFVASHDRTADISTQTTDAAAVTATRPEPQVAARITPALRRKLEKAGLSPADVLATGDHGRITKEDVDRAVLHGKAVASGAAAGYPLAPQQAAVARKLSQTQSTLPLYHVTLDVNVESALASLSTGASLNDLIIAAVQRSLQVHPALNQTFDGERLTPIEGEPVGVAVAAEGNRILAPVVQTSCDASLDELAQHSRELIERARSGRLTAADQRSAAITVSNLGMFGVTAFTAMVTPPQIMVLAVGAVRRVPVFNEANEVVPASVMTLTLGSDHRVVNGVQAAAFLTTVQAQLEAVV